MLCRCVCLLTCNVVCYICDDSMKAKTHDMSVLCCTEGVSTFQGKKKGVVKQLQDNFAPRLVGIHCMEKDLQPLAFIMW